VQADAIACWDACLACKASHSTSNTSVASDIARLTTNPTPQAGTLDTLIDGLPGFPDNINHSSDGSFWLALVVPDVPLVRSAGAVVGHEQLRD